MNPSNDNFFEVRKELGTPIVSDDGKTVVYGLYPQSHVNDPKLIDALNGTADSFGGDEEDSEAGWLEHGGAYYAKAKAMERDFEGAERVFDDGTPIVQGQEYWFLCEPIRWRVLKKMPQNRLMILSEKILDVCPFAPDYPGCIGGFYPNAYANCDVRRFLNGQFFNMAFALSNDMHVLLNNVDNGAATTDDEDNPYLGTRTDDWAFALSDKECMDASLGFADKESRTCLPSDYARALGAEADAFNKGSRNASYWLRSPAAEKGYMARSVRADGSVMRDCVDEKGIGVRPAMAIRCDDPLEDCVKPEYRYYGIYPQTHVTDSKLLEALNRLSPKEDVDPETTWYLHDGTFYAKEVAKPFDPNATFRDGTPIVAGEAYWFVCERISWRVLSQNADDSYRLMAEDLLDVMRFDEKSNNYLKSEVRAFLNGDFLVRAFSGIHPCKAYVCNRPMTTGDPDNPNAEADEDEYVSMLSYRDCLNTSFGFSCFDADNADRYGTPTDYARAKGAVYFYEESACPGCYWTRSPRAYREKEVWHVGVYGDVAPEKVYDGGTCIRPVVIADAYRLSFWGNKGE